MNKYFRIISTTITILAILNIANAVRIKDIAQIEGVRENQIVGYGLVIGLNGTGDGSDSTYTMQSLASVLKKMGLNISASDIDSQNIAAVLVTADLPPFCRQGSRLDVLVSSIGDAENLQGGTLLMTPLTGPDGETYAVAQGPISIGGFQAGNEGTTVQKNHPTVGVVSNGAIIEKEIVMDFTINNTMSLILKNPDFTTITRMQKAVNQTFGENTAVAENSSRLKINIPQSSGKDIVDFASKIESIEISPDTKAIIILDERTGTVVMGENVRISTVAVAHGSLSIQISTENDVSQPEPLSQGKTTKVSNTAITAQEGADRLTVVHEGVSISEVVAALNAIGVTPRDLIAIFQAIKSAGALQADLKII